MTVIALAAAALAAVCFALAATLQHRVVGAAGARHAAVTPRLLCALAGRPTWLAGLGLSMTGGLLHLVAIALAPLPVVQPVGALAVPVSVLLAARAGRRRPAGAVVAGAALTVGGVAAFVALCAGTATGGPVPAGHLAAAAAGAAATVGALAALALARTGWVRNVACATAAAVAFGTESVLLRALARLAGQAPLDTLLVLVGGVVAALVVGGWLVQQAFASGPAEPVVAALTVLDPIVAVGLATVLLGEGPTAPAGALLTAAAVASAGVLALARHHPDAAGRRRPHPERTPDDRPADPDRRRHLPA